MWRKLPLWSAALLLLVGAPPRGLAKEQRASARFQENAEANAEPAPEEPPPDFEEGFEPEPDRWEIPYPDSPRIVKGRLRDPYNQNILKGDKPIIGNTVFFAFTATSETPIEGRVLPVASGVSANDPDSLGFFGQGHQLFSSPKAILSAELFKGQTAFRPKDWVLRITPVFNLNYLRVQENNLVDIDVREGSSRRRQDFSLEEAFGEVKLVDVSPQFDTLSLRVGIQPFISDFRGLIFSDFNLGARLFGNASSNRWQYNLVFFDLLEKETNSELNTFERRQQQVWIANLFRQDFLSLGYTLSASVHHSLDHATIHFDANDFLVRPARIGSVRSHEVESTYFGVTGDGHIGRLNLSHAFYWVSGTDERHSLAGRPVDINAQMAALELSVDRDWMRFKGSLFFASGDGEPLDGDATGFDTIYDHMNFAGGPFSFWNRSAIALTQTGVLLKGPFTLLPNLRSNKFEGQANFVNPGVMLLNLGYDADLTPKLRAILNANYLFFHQTESLERLLFQPKIRKAIGLDWGGGILYRPLLSQNIVILAGVTGLLTGSGFDDIYTSPCDVPGCGTASRNLANLFGLVKFTY